LPLISSDVIASAELHRRIGWQHYLRAIQNMHEDTATENAALLHRLLSALEGGVGTAESTILLSHDGAMDGLALLLGLRWKIPPYASDCL
jgi:hypothetical protein